MAIEDAGRLRDALGTALPVGVPEAFTEPVADPLGDLVGRYARTHGPFLPAEVAHPARAGRRGRHRDPAAADGTGRLVSGEFRPGGDRPRVVRRRGAAVDPAPQPGQAAPGGRAGPGRHAGPVHPRLAVRGRPAARCGRRPGGGRAAGRRAGAGQRAGVAGAARPGPRLLPRDARRAHQRRGGAVGRRRRPARRRRLDQPGPRRPRAAAAARPAGAPGGGRRPGAARARPAGRRAGDVLPRPVRRASAPPTTPRWPTSCGTSSGPGALTNDTLAPLRTRLAGGGTHRRPAARSPGCAAPATAGPRLGRPAMPSRTGPPTVAGRWSRLPERETNPTRRTTARAEALLERHGVLTRGAVVAEQVTGGFSAVYPVLRAFEENGRARRGYFVETLGRGPVRHARRGRPAAHLRLPRPVAGPGAWCSPRPTRPTSTARRCPGRSGPTAASGAGRHRRGLRARPPDRRATGPAARRARWSCWSTASSCSTSSAAARPCCPGPRTSTCSRRPRRRCRARSPPARWAGWWCRRPTAPRCTRTTPLSAALQAAGFAATPRGLRLRG